MSARPPMWPAYRLSDSPELAVLDGLGHMLRIALSVTRAMTPSQATPWSDECPVRRRVVSQMLSQAESLLCTLSDYQLIARCNRCVHEAEDDDLPF